MLLVGNVATVTEGTANGQGWFMYTHRHSYQAALCSSKIYKTNIENSIGKQQAAAYQSLTSGPRLTDLCSGDTQQIMSDTIQLT